MLLFLLKLILILEHGYLTFFYNLEYYIRKLVIFFTNFLPVKVIRDDKGVPFLYRYYLFSFGKDGPGMCIHRFVKSDPDRGYHDHPWKRAVSFILCGQYFERIWTESKEEKYIEYKRSRWTFNYLNGIDNFHRVMIEENKDVWTLFAFLKRSKLWGMISLDGKYKNMSTTITDQDGGWWKVANKGISLNDHIQHSGNVVTMVDIIVLLINEGIKKILLIKRGKDPYKECWAFPGGRIEQKDKDIIAAAHRELKEETNLDNIILEYKKTIGNNYRDPRGFTLTNIFLAVFNEIPKDVKAGDDAIDYEWFDLDNLPNMAFDHQKILEDLNLI